MSRIPSRRTFLTLAMILGIGLAQSAFAAPVVYYAFDDSMSASRANSDAKRDEFLATLNGLYVHEDLDQHPPADFDFDPGSLAVNPTLTFGNQGIQAATSGAGATYTGYHTSPYTTLIGSGYFEEIVGDDIVFTFNRPIYAFGAYIANAGDSVEQKLHYQLNNGHTATMESSPGVETTIGSYSPNYLQDDVMFFGFTDTLPFTTVTLVRDNSSDVIMMDDIYATPEPSTLVLLGGMSAGMALMLARKRRGAVQG